MVRLLLLGVLALGVWGLILILRDLLRPSSPTSAAPKTGIPTLVRDPVCGVHIPQDRAVVRTWGDQTLYFCSESCAQAYAHRAGQRNLP